MAEDTREKGFFTKRVGRFEKWSWIVGTLVAAGAFVAFDPLDMFGAPQGGTADPKPEDPKAESGKPTTATTTPASDSKGGSTTPANTAGSNPDKNGNFDTAPNPKESIQGPPDSEDTDPKDNKNDPKGSKNETDRAGRPTDDEPYNAESDRRTKLINDQTYETQALNLDQYAERTEYLGEPPEDIVDGFRYVLADRLGVDPIELSDEELRQALENGSYTDEDGRTFEIWYDKDTGRFAFAENPHRAPDHAVVDGEAAEDDESTDDEQFENNDEEVAAPIEISDEERMDLTLSAKVLEDTPISDFARPNPYPDGTAEFIAFKTIQDFLTDNEEYFGQDWKRDKTPAGEFVTRTVNPE